MWFLSCLSCLINLQECCFHHGCQAQSDPSGSTWMKTTPAKPRELGPKKCIQTTGKTRRRRKKIRYTILASRRSGRESLARSTRTCASWNVWRRSSTRSLGCVGHRGWVLPASGHFAGQILQDESKEIYIELNYGFP